MSGISEAKALKTMPNAESPDGLGDDSTSSIPVSRTASIAGGVLGVGGVVGGLILSGCTPGRTETQTSTPEPTATPDLENLIKNQARDLAAEMVENAENQFENLDLDEPAGSVEDSIVKKGYPTTQQILEDGETTVFIAETDEEGIHPARFKDLQSGDLYSLIIVEGEDGNSVVLYENLSQNEGTQVSRLMVTEEGDIIGIDPTTEDGAVNLESSDSQLLVGGDVNLEIEGDLVAACNVETGESIDPEQGLNVLASIVKISKVPGAENSLITPTPTEEPTETPEATQTITATETAEATGQEEKVEQEIISNTFGNLTITMQAELAENLGYDEIKLNPELQDADSRLQEMIDLALAASFVKEGEFFVIPDQFVDSGQKYDLEEGPIKDFQREMEERGLQGLEGAKRLIQEKRRNGERIPYPVLKDPGKDGTEIVDLSKPVEIEFVTKPSQAPAKFQDRPYNSFGWFKKEDGGLKMTVYCEQTEEGVLLTRIPLALIILGRTKAQIGRLNFVEAGMLDEGKVGREIFDLFTIDGSFIVHLEKE